MQSIKSVEPEQPVQVGDFIMYAREKDGYINAGKLCAICGTKFAHYLGNKRAKKFLVELENFLKEGDITPPLMSTSRSENRHGTYVHPLIALNIAQWASPKFGVRVTSWIYEMFLTGSARNQESNVMTNQGEYTPIKPQEHLSLESNCIKQLENQIQQITKDYERLEVDLFLKNNSIKQLENQLQIKDSLVTQVTKYIENRPFHKEAPVVTPLKTQQSDEKAAPVVIPLKMEEQILNDYELEVKYERTREQKTRYKFERGNCFYIVRDLGCKSKMYKFGQTTNFTNRLTSLRTGSPRMTIERLIYIEQHVEFEECLKKYFREHGYLKFSNHEFVEIPLDFVNEIIDTHLSKFDCNINEIPVYVLQQVNKKYFDCLSDEDSKNIDNIFDYIQTTSDIDIEELANTLNKLEQCTNKLHLRSNTHEVKIKEMQQVVFNKEPAHMQINVNRVVNIGDLIIEEFEYQHALKRRIRKTDFDFIISKIDKHCIIGTHRWFIHQFIFHLCYYTGIAPKLLITLNRQDIIDYINGTFNRFPLFINSFVMTKFEFLLPHIDKLLPGGMVNTYGNKLTHRQLSKWVDVYFDELEMNNFGKLLPFSESYRLYDFKTIMLIRLHNSGMSISDISVYMHHKNISATEFHLNSHNMIYNQQFEPPIGD